MADELIDIADDGTDDDVDKERPDGSRHAALDAEPVRRSRLPVDIRKWLLSKVEVTGNDGGVEVRLAEEAAPAEEEV